MRFKTHMHLDLITTSLYRLRSFLRS